MVRVRVRVRVRVSPARTVTMCTVREVRHAQRDVRCMVAPLLRRRSVGRVVWVLQSVRVDAATDSC